MNLVNGKILDAAQCAPVLENLYASICKTLEKPSPDPSIVIHACDVLSDSLDEGYLPLLYEAGISEKDAPFYLAQAKQMLSKEYLAYRLEKELGRTIGKQQAITPLFSEKPVAETVLPLGVLFHIAAGNMDALPFYSVIEGLLAGNINILKLPAEEGGITVKILTALFEIEPLLAEYVYVFDYSSSDTSELQLLAEVADAIVVWGGDVAVSAARQMAKPNTRIIEWGHKLGFAYVSGQPSHSDMQVLAKSMVETEQLLCSSCQGIYVDTDNMQDLYAFCEAFFPILENASKEKQRPIEVEAQIGLQLYNESLERIHKPRKIYQSENCSVIAYEDSELELSLQFGNCWAKRLGRDAIIPTLKKHKNHLQTACLLCDEAARDELSALLFRAGVVRLASGHGIANPYYGAAHDGEYPLRRYTKTVSDEF